MGQSPSLGSLSSAEAALHRREAGEKGKKILFPSSPAHFLFFHYCHFYRNTQREIRRRREPNVGFLIPATGGSKTIQPIACVAGRILVAVVFSSFSAAEPVREASGEAARAYLASYAGHGPTESGLHLCAYQLHV